jgi:hypothetical protein
MNEVIRVLKADIHAARQSIEQSYTALARYEGMTLSEEQTIVVAYHLHNLYSAFEDVFQRVAETFENQVSDRAQWHAQLLRRMTLDIEDVRPRLLSSEAFDCLDELRRFRHVFRSAYAVSLDPQRLELVRGKARSLRTVYGGDFDRFFAYLDQIDQ